MEDAVYLGLIICIFASTLILIGVCVLAAITLKRLKTLREEVKTTESELDALIKNSNDANAKEFAKLRHLLSESVSSLNDTVSRKK